MKESSEKYLNRELSSRYKHLSILLDEYDLQLHRFMESEVEEERNYFRDVICELTWLREAVDAEIESLKNLLGLVTLKLMMEGK